VAFESNQSGIETGYLHTYASPIQRLNRTKVELKLYMPARHNKDNHRLNRTKVELKQIDLDKSNLRHIRLNRTKVELKRPYECCFHVCVSFESNQSGIETVITEWLNRDLQRLNRTKVELKQIFLADWLLINLGLNRTKVELKLCNKMLYYRYQSQFESNQSGIET